MQPGTELAHYEILSALGKGGMGEVWRARDTKLGREVAIKTLPSEFDQDADRLARFEREAQLLASLNHTNIAAIYGLEEHEGSQFLVLELVEGDTLADRLKRGAIPVEESLKLALQIAEALEAAHEKGVIHRDLKPANIKVTPDGKVKVLDFGLAKAFGGEDAEANISESPTLSMAATQQGIILGTAAYMSPEQAKGRTVDKRTDVWAFGCVLYEMLTGRQVFGAEDVTTIMARVVDRDPDFTPLPANLNPRLGDLLDRSLQKDVKRRYHDIADLRLDIERVVADPSGLIVQGVSDVVKTSPRKNLPWIAITIFLIVLSASVAVWLGKSTPAETGNIGRFAYVLDAGEVFIASGGPLVAISPDGTRIAYVADQQIYVQNLDEWDARPVPGTDVTPSAPFFSHDGQWIGFWAPADSQLKKVPVTGGTPVPLGAATNPFGVSWSADDLIVFGQPGGIFGVSGTGGTPELLIASEEGEQVHGPEILPGTRTILYSVASGTSDARWDEADIVVQSMDGGERTVLLTSGTDAHYVPTGHLVYRRGDTLFAIVFDTSDVATVGGEVPVIEDVVRSGTPGTNTASANYGFYGFSDDGTLVYTPGSAASDFPRALTHVDEQGNSTALTDQTRDYTRPRVSPDGTRIAVTITDPVGGTHIWVLNVETKVLRQFTFVGTNNIAAWTPDSERLVFQSDRTGSLGLFIQDANGVGIPEPILASQDAPWVGSISPEGILAFYEITDQGRDMWTLSLESLVATEFLVSSANERNPVFSPDGRWIAYTSDESGQDEVYVRPYPTTTGSFLRKLSDSGGEQPRWSRDGRVLYYIDPNRGLMMASAIETDPVFTPERPREVFPDVERFRRETNSGGYDVHPDNGFVMVSAAAVGADSSANTSPEIKVVLNWFEELTERVPGPPPPWWQFWKWFS